MILSDREKKLLLCAGEKIIREKGVITIDSVNTYLSGLSSPGISGNRFEIQVEMLNQLLSKGYKIKAVKFNELLSCADFKLE